MIDISKAYKTVEYESGAKASVLEFNCEYCGEPLNRFSLNISVFLYGVGFLGSPGKECYTFITCPSCLKTVGLKEEGIHQLYNHFLMFDGPKGSYYQVAPTYHSSVVFSFDEIPQLAGFDIKHLVISLENTNKQLYDNELFYFISETFPGPKVLRINSRKRFKKKLKRKLLKKWIKTEKRPPEKPSHYLGTGLNDGLLPAGCFASIWWVKADDVEALLQIENDERLRIFPDTYIGCPFMNDMIGLRGSFASIKTTSTI